MKVTYEFDEEDEHDARKLFEISGDMLSALYEISEYVREIDRGYKEHTIEIMIETIREFIYDSGIHKIP